jgi:hypothetical protein
MLIALDHDGTYTADPLMWDALIFAALNRGHQVVCVTMRYPHEQVALPCEVIYTSRKAKAAHMATLGLAPDVWIDDKPQWIFQDSF